jgi:type II secretory pathway pseudopilin PulG
MLSSSSGFTFIAALVIVTVMGIMLGAAGQSWRVIMKREKEKELLFRGMQYRDAIERWTKKGAMPLLDIKFLLQDPRSATGERHLRRLYDDPMTGKEWKTLVDPNTKEIFGVVSTSDDRAFKKANFPEALKDFEGKEKYSEWQFIYRRQVQTPRGATTQAQPQAAFPLSVPEGP